MAHLSMPAFARALLERVHITTYTTRLLIDTHAERSATPLFRHNKARLLSEHPGCWMAGPECEPDASLEAHHIVAWALRERVDYVRLARVLAAFDPYGYSRELAGVPILSIDDIRNLMLLCPRDHRAIGAGVHALDMGTWLARAAVRAGTAITVEDAAHPDAPPVSG